MVSPQGPDQEDLDLNTWRFRLASLFVDQNLSKISKKGTNII